jgi:uncharacterized membrane protein
MFTLIVVLVAFFYLYSKIEKLETKLDKLTNQDRSQAEPRPEASYLEANSQATAQTFDAMMRTEGLAKPPAEVGGSYPRDPEPQEDSAFVAWVKKDFMVKLGAFLLLIALGWFVSYAFANNWIGPVGRITIGLLVGAAFMVGGTLRAKVSLNQAGIFAVLGSGIILMTVYAAREMYDLFTPVSALFVMFMSVVFVAKLAVTYRLVNVAVAGLCLAAVAPFLTASPSAEVFMLFSYLAVIVLGTIWILYILKSDILLLLALAIVFLYSLPYMVTGGADALIALSFGFFFTLVFFVANLTIFIRRPDTIGIMNYLVAIGTGLYLLFWIFETKAFEEGFRALVYIAWALVFAYGAFIVYRILNNKIPFYLYGAVSLGLLAAATASILEGEVLTIVYTIQITALVLLAKELLNEESVARRLSWLYAVPIVMAVESLDSSAWARGEIIGSDSLVVINLIICLAVSAFVLYQKIEDKSVDASTVLAAISGLFAVAWVWISAHAALPHEQGTMLALLVYLVTGLVLYIEGKSLNIYGLRVAGGFLIALVVGRLLLVEVWAMSVAGRIVIFTIVGLALISTAFIKKLNKENHD